MNRSFHRFDTRKTNSLVSAIAFLALCLPAVGCAFGSEGGEDSRQVQSSATKSSKGNAGAAGSSVTPDRSALGGSAGSASWNPGGSAGSNAVGGAAGSNSSVGGSAGSTNTCGDQEICNNDKDDDCNGETDEGCVVVCEDTEGHNCNGDDGHGDRCDPSDNTNGCSEAKFWAWCNRRNDAYPNIWDNYLQKWVEDRCGGEAELLDPNNDGYPTFTCVDDYGRSWQCTTPLVLSFQGEAVRFEQSAHTFTLDTSRPNSIAKDWPTAATPWLAYDRNGNCSIDNGSELFGSSTPLAAGGQARNGFEALAELDDNHDGRINEKDSAWANLLVWSDRNQDGVSQKDELVSVGQLGVTAIGLSYEVQSRCDGRGNCERERATFEWSDGSAVRTGEVIDVYLRTELAR